MLKIRLQRIGKKHQAHYKIVVLEHTKKPQGEYMEQLGTYDPHAKAFKANRERIEYWMSKGAQISPTVNNLMVNYKVWDRPKVESWKPKPKKEEAK
jgi:small subunit ribosomal protein S16